MTPEARELLPAIGAFTSRQAGVCSREQLQAAGLSQRRILRWKDVGWIRPEARGVYSLAGAEIRQAGRLWAATLSVGGDAAVSGLQAVDLLGLTNEVGTPVNVVVSNRSPRPQPGIVVQRTPSLPERDVVEVDGNRTTSAARTIFGVAGTVPDRKLDKIIDRAIHLRMFDHDAIEQLFVDWPRALGRPQLRAAIDRLNVTSGNNRSDLEEELISLILSSDIPTPATNTMLHGFEVDVHWIGTRAIVEADGDRYHSSPAQIAADIAKRKVLQALGFVIKRFDHRAITYEPERTLERAERFRLANLAPPVPRR